MAKTKGRSDMMKAAAVRIGSTIRVTGDPELAHQMGMTLAVPELERLRAEMGVRKTRDSKYWEAKIAEAERKYGKPRRIHRHEVFLAWMAEAFRAWRAGM